jgi:hypothetical protein
MEGDDGLSMAIISIAIPSLKVREVSGRFHIQSTD